MRSTTRAASAKDLPVIAALYSAAAAEQDALKPGWEAQAGWGKVASGVIAGIVASHTLDGWPAEVFVAEIDGAIAGYVIASLEPFPGGELEGCPVRLKMHHLFVDEEARGVGCGELLLAVAARWGQARGAAVCELEVLPGHRSAKNFCEAHGLRARSITMSGSIEGALAGIELDEYEETSVEEAVEGALAHPSPPPRHEAKVAAGCIVVSGGKVLFARREDPPFVGWWSIPGGHPHPGESLSECAKREILEETGLGVRILGLAGIAERSWRGEPGLSGDYLIVNFVGIPEEVGSSAAAKGAGSGDRSESTWAVPESIPEPAVPGVATFLRRAAGIVEAIAAGRPLPAAVFSPAEDV